MCIIKSQFKKGGIYNVDLAGYLKRFLKKDFKNEAEFDKYKIYLFYTNSMGYGGVYGDIVDRRIYFDAYYNFVLLYDRIPICSIGFNRSGLFKRSTILVKQIQGVRNQQDKLIPFRWEKMLLQILIDWARQNKVKRIGVIRSKDSEWYSDNTGGKAQRMYLKYDITARRMGFKFDEKRKVYSLSFKKEIK